MKCLIHKSTVTLLIALTLTGCDPITMAVVGPTVGALGGMAVGAGINAMIKPDSRDSETVEPKN